MPKLENQVNSRVSGKQVWQVRSQSRPPRSAVQQASIETKRDAKTLEIQRFRGFCMHEKTFLDLFREWNII